jgi:hypothetical protein
MNPDPKAMKPALQKRELELRRLLRQMHMDKLHNSPVFRNLETELEHIKKQLALPAEDSARN